MTMQEAIQLIDAVVRYAYNVEFDEFKKLYGTQDKAYLMSKYKLMQKDVGSFFGQLDDEHRIRFVQLVVERYARTAAITIPVENE